MSTTVYVDGSGGPNGGFGYFVKETGDSFYDTQPGITSNQAEYKALLAALDNLAGLHQNITVYSDSQIMVNQINHQYAINNSTLRDMARQAWSLISGYDKVDIKWIPRKQNLAGKMLGS